MAQTVQLMQKQINASYDAMLRDYRRQVQGGLVGRYAQIPIQIEAGSMANVVDGTRPMTAASLTNVLKDTWTGDAMRLGLMPGRAPYSHIRSNRTRRTGLSYRQRQARGRAARRTG